MRVTNNMIMSNARTNINGTKVSVDKANTQMTTQKKISRPSEDPVTAIRSLRLSTSLSRVDQFYKKNIPDAESWLDVTETAMNNMKSLITDFHTLCVNGSTGTLTADDRNTIHSQLTALQKQMYCEGNADYAGRSVFTGYRTDQTLTFMDNELEKSYNITQTFNAVKDMDEYRYYNGKVTVPSNEAEILSNDIADMESWTHNRIRLGYDKLDDVRSLKLGDMIFNIGDMQLNATSNEWEYEAKAGVATDFTIATDTNGKIYSVNSVPPTELTDADGNKYTVTDDKITVDGKEINFTTKTTKNEELTAVDKDGNAIAPPVTLFIYETEEDWALDNASVSGESAGKSIAGDRLCIIKETGEIVFGKELAAKLKSDNATIEINYDKTGFKEGELKPENYYNCTDISDRLEEDNWTTYTKYDADGSEIRFDINYTIASNQELTVNTMASDVFDASIYQDIQDMLDAVSNAVDAHDKLDKIDSMIKASQYQSIEDQERLSQWKNAVQKEADYYDDNLKQLFSRYIGKGDVYLEDIALNITKVGCKSDQLAMTKNRMADQQETLQDLQSTNDDLDLSDIVLTYTAAYTAYQASLTAAGKLGQVSLLNYI